MKSGIHPEYGPVVFQDRNTGKQFLTSSTATSTWASPGVCIPSSRRRGCG